MEPGQILLLIVVLVSFTYVTLAVYVLGKMRQFRSRLRRRLRSLNLLLYERSSALADIQNVFDAHGIALSKEDEEALLSVRRLRFDRPNEESTRQSASLIKEVVSRVKYLASANPVISEDERYQANVNLLDDLERNYRAFTGKYNADVVAYNYWIKIPTIGWLGFLFGHRKRANIT